MIAPLSLIPLVYLSTIPQLQSLGSSSLRIPHFSSQTCSSKVTPRVKHSLLIPNGWWHAVEALSDSVSLGGRGLTLCEGLSFAPWWSAELAEEILGAGTGWMAVRLAVAAGSTCALAYLGLMIDGICGRSSTSEDRVSHIEAASPTGARDRTAESAAHDREGRLTPPQQMDGSECMPLSGAASSSARPPAPSSNPPSCTRCRHCVVVSSVAGGLCLLLAYAASIAVCPPVPPPSKV